MKKKLCSKRVPFWVFAPHLFSDIKACPAFDIQHITSKIGRKLANSIDYNISKACIHII